MAWSDRMIAEEFEDDAVAEPEHLEDYEIAALPIIR